MALRYSSEAKIDLLTIDGAPGGDRDESLADDE